MAKPSDSDDLSLRDAGPILGIDEAGRGPAIGPLVVAGVLSNPDTEARLTDLGVRDSKDLTPERRHELIEGIRKVALATQVVAFAPIQLNDNLNAVELRAIVRLIDILAPRALLLDAPVGPRAIPAFVETLQRRCRQSDLDITAENKADARYPVVAAASILAKVYRDEAIARLHGVYGDFGSGYPADPKTQRFLNEWYDAHRSFPACVRTRWGTVQTIIRDQSSERLIEASPRTTEQPDSAES